MYAEATRSGSDKPSLLRSPATPRFHEDRGEEGLSVGEGGGEDGREDDLRGLEELRSSFMSLSPKCVKRDFIGEGWEEGPCASGCVLPSASGSGRQHSQPVIRRGLRWIHHGQGVSLFILNIKTAHSRVIIFKRSQISQHNV